MARNSDLADLAVSILAAGSDDREGTGLDTAAWKACAGAGLTSLTDPETGGTLDDAAVLLEVAGAAAARLPLAETDLLAGWLARAAGLAVPDGPLAAVVTDATGGDRPAGAAGGALTGGGTHGGAVSAELTRVPWGRSLAAVVVLDGDRVLVLDVAAARVTEGVNLAEEPRDGLTLDAVTPTATGTAPAGAATELTLRAALARSLLLAGAARGALAASVAYAGERTQFGRPIGRFQAVQQMLAEAASEVAAASAASAAATSTAQRAGFAAAETAFAVAAAKARCSEAATAVARISHQVHGAIGFTREHALRLVTTRLWAWRDEDGNEAYWNDRVGAAALAAGADGLWPLVTGRP